MSLRLHSFLFSFPSLPFSLTPFFLCQFLFNWTFCHQTRFITWAAVEGNGAEIRICSVRDMGPSTEGCDLAGRLRSFAPPPHKPLRGALRFPPLEECGGGGAGVGRGRWWEAAGEEEGGGFVRGSWDPSGVAWIPALTLYLLSCVTFKPCKQ